MKRRNFIRLSSSAAALCFIESHILFSNSTFTTIPGSKLPLIAELQLLTSTPLEDMKKFYTQLIGFSLVSESATELNLQCGGTAITFVKINKPGVRPFYHFAFNIPENKILEAYAWQKSKTPIIMPRPEARNDGRTAGHPREIYHFRHWNAHAFYFLDPAGNLVEYIARHELPNGASGGFSVEDILYASEIGFIVDRPGDEARHVQNDLGLLPYAGNSDTFQPMGDAYGLLLVLQRGNVWTGPDGKGQKTDVFTTKVTIRTDQVQEWQLPGYPYQVISAG